MRWLSDPRITTGVLDEWTRTEDCHLEALRSRYVDMSSIPQTTHSLSKDTNSFATQRCDAALPRFPTHVISH